VILKMPRVIDMVVDMVAEAGIDHVFGLPGGVTPFLLEEFYKRKDKFTTIIARQEGAAAIMADVYGRITRKPGILIGQGPFIATNGGVGIIEAYMAGSPMVIITDASDWNGINQHAPYQCGTGEYGTIDVPNILRSMTKYTTVATNPQEVIYGVELAIKHAISGRPGPTCVVARWQSMIGVIKDPMELRPRKPRSTMRSRYTRLKCL
jgi:acetolactate synthase-1/2/3 large subunit